MNIVNNRCEVNRLKKMIVHRPGEELNNLVPHYLEIQLFDDIPWLSMAQKEHDEYVKLLKGLGVEVYELIDLVADSIGDNKDLLKELVERFIAEANIYGTSKREYIHDYLLDKSPRDAIDLMISGFRKSEINVKGNHLSDMLSDDYPFVLDPMPNAYFTRDPFSFVGNGIIISKMYKQARSRETLFGSFIMEHNPLFKDTPIYYNRDGRFAVEGGDIMVLSPDTLAIGVSQRTNANAVEEIARNILSDEKSGFKTILAVDIPKTRSYMHLDTVFTMVDYNKFAIHPNVAHEFRPYAITMLNNKLHIEKAEGKFDDILCKYLQQDKITLIECGGKSYVDSAREQWNDGANTLAVAPGEIIVYARNQFTNKLFVDNGIKIHEIPCSELSRGRGGPHCMSMAIERE